jgi:hypothetical protein
MPPAGKSTGITGAEPFQGLNTTPAVAGLRAKPQPKCQGTYALLCKVLREESGIDLEREIIEEQRRANDRLAVVREHGTNQHGGHDNIKSSQGGTSRSYIVGRLRREAAKAEGQDPLFLADKVRLAAALLPQVEANEISARAAAIAMGWQKAVPRDVESGEIMSHACW